MSPTARTLAMLEASGHLVAKTETYNGFGGVRKDLFGVFDLVALHRDAQGVLGLQVTTDSNRSARRKKILASAEAKQWVACGNRIWLVTWGKKRGGKLWIPTIEKIEVGMWGW